MENKVYPAMATKIRHKPQNNLLKISFLILAICAATLLWLLPRNTSVTLERINPVHKATALVEDAHYAQAAAYLDFFMQFDYVRNDPEAVALYQQIEAIRSSWGYRANKTWEGIAYGSSDEAIGQISATVSDVMVIGDIRDFSTEFYHLLSGTKYDGTVMTLSALGIASTAGGFAAIPIKRGVGFLKVAKKANTLPHWLIKALNASAEKIATTVGKNMKNIGRTTSLTNFLNQMMEEKSVLAGTLSIELAEYKKLLSNITIIASTKGGLILLGKTIDPESLTKVSQYCELFGNHAITIYDIAGEQAIDSAVQYQSDNSKKVFERAVTYGNSGISLLDRLGTETFTHKLNQAEILATHGKPVIHIAVSDSVLTIRWLLIIVIAICVCIWIPWRWFYHTAMRYIMRKKYSTESK